MMLLLSRFYGVDGRIINERGEIGGIKTGRENGNVGGKSSPVPLCPSQILHVLNSDRTRAAAVGNRSKFDTYGICNAFFSKTG
jgi:hypothetical protein